MQRIWLAVAAAVAWSAAIAQTVDVEIGVLTCTLAQPGDAPASDTPAVRGQMRDVLCSFQPKRGAGETYVGRVQGVSLSPDAKATVMWLVKAPTGAGLDVGFLEQGYATDPKASAEQMAPMIGEKDASIVLHSMSDKQEGSASAPQKASPTGFVIIGVELKLKSTSG
jgi:hypothetical protein